MSHILKGINMKKIIIATLACLLTISLGVMANTLIFKNKAIKTDDIRQELTINDVLTKPKNKVSLLNNINPKEQYAIGIVVQQTPVSERDSLKNKTLGEVIKIYETNTGETVPEGQISYKDLKYKELTSIEAAKFLFALSTPQSDKDIMEVYMTKYFLNKQDMKVLNEKTVGEIIETAKTEMPELYQKFVTYNKQKEQEKKKKTDNKSSTPS